MNALKQKGSRRVIAEAQVLTGSGPGFDQRPSLHEYLSEQERRNAITYKNPEVLPKKRRLPLSSRGIDRHKSKIPGLRLIPKRGFAATKQLSKLILLRIWAKWPKH